MRDVDAKIYQISDGYKLEYHDHRDHEHIKGWDEELHYNTFDEALDSDWFDLNSLLDIVIFRAHDCGRAHDIVVEDYNPEDINDVTLKAIDLFKIKIDLPVKS